MKRLKKKIKNWYLVKVSFYNGEIGALNNCDCNTKVGC